MINLNSKKLNYGVLIGFKLSRLEWLWGSKFKEAITQFTPSKNEIISKLPKNICINESSYMNFANSILDYFFKSDLDIHYAILIGMCIQRCMLYGVSNSKDKNDKLLEIAKSSLISIPSHIIPNKTEFINFIISNKSDNIFEIINKIEQSKNNNNNNNIFISYRRDSAIDIAARVRDFFSSKGFNVFYDITSMQLGEFDKQIFHHINSSGYFILILSKNALDRCCYEYDWVRMEIECALSNDSIKIIPLILPQFEFPNNLPDSLKNIKRYHGIEYNAVLFDLVMERILQLIDKSYSTTKTQNKEELIALINELYSITIDFRESLRDGHQTKISVTTLHLTSYLQKIYYYYEKHIYSERELSQIALTICNQYNTFVPHYNKFANSNDRMSIIAQNEAKLAEEEFNKFVSLLLNSLKRLNAN